MSPNASELLFESEAALRMVDSAIGELHPSTPDGADRSGDSAEHSEEPSVPRRMLQAHDEIERMLEQVRASRGVLEQPVPSRVSHLQSKLMEVTSVSQSATNDILNGLEHALSLVDSLDSLAADDDSSARAGEIRMTLREELFRMMQPLQFQDITAQQLAYASNVITQMEDRLTNLVSLFDPSARSTPFVSAMPLGAFDPNATCNTAEDAQARVDEELRAHR